MRAMNLADAMLDRGHDVTILSSDYSHQKKKHRTGKFSIFVLGDRFRIILFPSPGYAKNLSLSRIFDHIVLSLRLSVYLRSFNESPPDCIFIGYPPIETSFVMTCWASSSRIPTILDVKDLWPDLFLDPFPCFLRPFVRFCFLPWFLMSRFCYRKATALSSMSLPYLRHVATKINRKISNLDSVNPLTARSQDVPSEEYQDALSWWENHGVFNDKRPRFIFVGTFMSVFDFEPIRIAAIKLLENHKDCQFVICGSGGSHQEVINCFKGLPNCVLPGWINLPQLQVLSDFSTASLVPYRCIENFTINIPNKVVDSLRLGLPILTSLTGSVQALVEENLVGFCYSAYPNRELYSCILQLLADDGLQSSMSNRARALYEKSFDYDKIYSDLCRTIEHFA